MEFKVEITCAKCRCKFQLRPTEFIERETLLCPNCQQPFPAPEYELLRTGIISLANVPDYIPAGAGVFDVDQQQFEVKIKEWGFLEHD